MTRRSYFALYLCGALVLLALSQYQKTPGYMDADYYYLGGLRLATGFGFSEPILWNYLDMPKGLPHPSHAYWMPLTSILSALGIKLVGASVFRPLDGFAAARLIFVALGAFISPLTAWIAVTLNSSHRGALLAGLLALLPGFYLPFLGTTDTFGVYMVLGGLFLQVAWLMYRNNDRSPAEKFAPTILGVFVGLMHLARADGLLWVVVGLSVIFLRSRSLGDRPDESQIGLFIRKFAGRSAYFIVGYMLIAGPWFIRNLIEFGVPLAPGGIRALWLTDYDQIYAFPALTLTPARWLHSGLSAILRSRLDAIVQNLVSTVAVQGQIFLTPLMLLGLWKHRSDVRVRAAIIGWLLTFLSMSLAFPFVGARGGFFHSGAALQPLFWAVVPSGLRVAIDAGHCWRGWQVDQARRFFSVGLVLLALLLSGQIVRQRIIGPDFQQPLWDQSTKSYQELEEFLQSLGAEMGQTVLVNNPPGYYLASGRPAIVIPDGDLEMALNAAGRYQAEYLLLEVNHPRPLQELYVEPHDRPGFRYLGSAGGTHIFAIEDTLQQ